MFKKSIATLMMLFTLVNTSHAGTTALGGELNTTTVESLKHQFEETNYLKELGASPYSNGPLLSVSGDAFGIDGLKKVNYVFDQHHKLVAMVALFNKDSFDNVYKAIKSKHKESQKNIPFVGNKFVKFNTSDGFIEIDAPHLSFEMTVLYTTTEFFRMYQRANNQETQTKRQKEKETL